MHETNIKEEDFDKPWISDLNGPKKPYYGEGILFLDEMPAPEAGAVNDKYGLDRSDRNLLTAGMLTGRKDLLSLFSHNIHGNAYLNVEGLRREMDKWVFPLHMIDFESSSVALPFYEGMRPYESIAFQFSHHIIRRDGSIEPLRLFVSGLTDDERQILLDGCLMNHDNFRAEREGKQGKNQKYQ